MKQETDPFYLSRRWQRLRRAILARDGFRDVVAARYGRNLEANTVHHIFPRREFPAYAWEPWNLVSVSEWTHARLEDRTNGELTAMGRELLRRTARKRGVKIPEKYAG